MRKINDIDKIRSGEEQYEPLRGPGWMVKFKLPEPVDKELVERISNKIKDKNKDTKNGND